MISFSYILYIFIFYWHCFHMVLRKVFDVVYKISKPLSRFYINSIQLIHHNIFSSYFYLSYHSSCTSIFQLSVLTNLGFIPSCLKFLVTMSDNWRPPSHHIVLFILYSLQSLTKYILLEKCLFFLVSLPFLAIHASYLISNKIRGAC